MLLLASEVWEPLASGDPAYKSKDFVVRVVSAVSANEDSASRRESLRNRAPGQVADSRQLVSP